jgi:hypothetical protein
LLPHHHKRGFEEEFVAFLNKHKIAYDPKYGFGLKSAVPSELAMALVQSGQWIQDY